MTTTERRYRCAVCGEDMGAWTKFCDKTDTCGKPECERQVRDDMRAEQEEAHRDLDERKGWSSW